MFTVAAFRQSITSTALIAITAVNDPHLTVAGNDVRVPIFATKLLAAYASGVDILQAQLNSPSLRSFVPFDIAPTDRAALPASAKPLAENWDTPYELIVNEPLNALIANTAAGANLVNAIVWLGDAAITPITGEILTVRATSATALVAGAWTNCPLTFANVLPAGKYAVVGMRAESTTVLAARLVLPGFGHRPGCLGNASSGIGATDKMFRYGNLGRWGEFVNTAPPTVDYLATAADAAEIVWLDIMQIS